MNKTLILLFALGCLAGECPGAEPAPSRLSLETTVGTGVSMSTPASTPFLWQIKGYYHLSGRWALGAGTGVSCYEKNLIPVFATGSFDLTRPHRLTPYLECGVGYGFAPQRPANGGFMLAPSVGVRFRLLSQAMTFSAGYERQELERLKNHTGPDFTVEFQERLSHHSLTFRLGISF